VVTEAKGGADDGLLLRIGLGLSCLAEGKEEKMLTL
jgi:hypothetical protein